MSRQVGEDLARLEIADHRADRNPQDDIVGARAGALSAAPALTVLGPMQPATDSVQFEIDNAQGASQTSVTCTLPMTPASCTVPARANYSDAYVLEVETTYRFQFTPLFQAVLAGVQYAGFTRAYVNLTSEAKAYIE